MVDKINEANNLRFGVLSPEKAGVGGSIPSLATTSKQSTYIKLQQFENRSDFELRPSGVRTGNRLPKWTLQRSQGHAVGVGGFFASSCRFLLLARNAERSTVWTASPLRGYCASPLRM